MMKLGNQYIDRKTWLRRNLKSAKIDKDYYKKRKISNEKKILLVISEHLLGSSTTIVSSTLSIIITTIAIPMQVALL